MPELIALAAPSQPEEYRLAAFRRAARQVVQAFRPHRELNLNYRYFTENPEHSGFIPWPEFRPLCLALRLIYMPSEPAHVEKVLAIIERVPEDWVSELCNRIRADWKAALRGRIAMSIDGHTYTPASVLETWFYALAFHQDEKKQMDAVRLADSEPTASFALQMCVWQLCVCVYNLDRLVAHLLGEPQLPELEQSDDDPPFAFGAAAI